MKKNTNDSAKVYTPLTLKIYDWWVLGVSNRFAWGCPTREYLLPHFLQHIGKKHLDIGVGTGYYLPVIPAEYSISLLDLNEASLEAASRRAGSNRITKRIQHDVCQSFPDMMLKQYDSVSMFYLLHCLPGVMEQKSPVIKNAAEALTDDGVLFGATILGKGVQHNLFGRKLMHIYNKKGIFSNTLDSEESLAKILSEHFNTVNIKREGMVALFSATNKK
ncbi:class I SAM-dependent methyltransferase [Citrobacter braakii]|uniref:class I SAM-dependent methyltransferase n=1 Tax=Citrobacter braakii TaxID=57706 RepID=UPI0018EB8CA1|nr:class I SAM-dependent methyltransferase [Citrobacter braakii]MBJ9240720.1 class I SAM-dependent methyltransferase [Citrobacter braakii]